MNWKSCTSVAFCILTLLSAGCGNKSNDSSSSATAASSSTSADNLEKQKKVEEEKKAQLEKAKPVIQEWGNNICRLSDDVVEQWNYWWPQSQGFGVSNFKAVQTLNINIGQYYNSLVNRSGKIPNDMPEDIEVKMKYVHDELDKSISITEDLTAKYAEMIKEGQPLRSGQKKLIKVMQDDMNTHRANAINKLKEIYSDIGVEMPNISSDGLDASTIESTADSDRVEIKY